VTRYRLTTEVFSLPRSEGHLVYAPLIQTSVVVNDAALALLSDIAAERIVRRDARSREVLDLLEDLEVISRTGDGEAPAEQGGGAADRTSPPPAVPAPTEVTLFLTSACNLRCVYCYASGGDHSRFLDPEVAFDAVDLVVANAVAQGRPEVRLSFHGGGEPTLAGDTLRRSVDRARRACDAQGLRLSTGTATNGVMDDEMRHYLAATMTSVMVSVDGPPEVQDRLRPRPGGGPSSAAVERTLARLSESDAVLGVRLTCTAEALDHAAETVHYLATTYRLRTIHLEPLFMCGRSVGSGLQAPTAARFVEAFRACRREAADLGVELAYSGAHQSSLCRTFCQASLPSFNVTTEGDATACYEVTGRDDPRAGVFIYGAHDPATRTFVFDPARVAALRRLTVDEAPRCSRCFAKYHCAGDCPAKRMYAGADEAVLARCGINRRLTLDQLEEVIQCPTSSPATV
jgi:uncharacterized protein